MSISLHGSFDIAQQIVVPGLEKNQQLYSGGVGPQDWLFPPSHTYSAGWTTSAFVNLPYVNNVGLLDDALGVHRVRSRTPHLVVTAPHSSSEQQQAWEAFYPKGSINPSAEIAGGFGFYMSGPEAFKNRLQTATEVMIGYSVFFEEGFEWVKGGKLPGIYGGIGDSAYSCTGGRQKERDGCFNLRLMWRSLGAGELYAYLPFNEDNDSRLSAVPPYSRRNPDYGYSVGRKSFTFRTGQWITITERVKLNDVEQNNGEIEIQVDGTTVINVTGLIFRNSEQSHIQGTHFETFFGGHGPEWASPKDQKSWFADVSGAILA